MVTAVVTWQLSLLDHTSDSTGGSTRLAVDVEEDVTVPGPHVDESYTLTVNTNGTRDVLEVGFGQISGFKFHFATLT